MSQVKVLYNQYINEIYSQEMSLAYFNFFHYKPMVNNFPHANLSITEGTEGVYLTATCPTTGIELASELLQYH